MNPSFSNPTLAGRTALRQPAWVWYLAGIMLAVGPARAELIQTNWTRQFGLGTLNGAVYSPQGDAYD